MNSFLTRKDGMIMRFDDVIYEQLRFLLRIYNRTIEFNGSNKVEKS